MGGGLVGFVFVRSLTPLYIQVGGGSVPFFFVLLPYSCRLNLFLVVVEDTHLEVGYRPLVHGFEQRYFSDEDNIPWRLAFLEEVLASIMCNCSICYLDNFFAFHPFFFSYGSCHPKRAPG